MRRERAARDNRGAAHASTCSKNSTTSSWPSGLPVAHVYRVQAGEIIAEQGEETRGLQLLLDGDAQASIVDGASSEPVGRHKAPTWMGAIATLTGGSLGVRMRRRDRLPPRADRAPRSFDASPSPSP